MAHKKQISTSKAPPALGPYSQAVWVDNLLFLSGQIPLNNLGELVVGSIEEQAEQIFANINAIIETAGGTLNDVVKLSVFVTDMANFEAINNVMMTLFSEPYPVRTTVEVSALPKNAALEIEALVNIKPHKQGWLYIVLATKIGTDLIDLKGVGPALVSKLQKLKVHNQYDLLFLLPIRYEDKTSLHKISDLVAGEKALIQGFIVLTTIVYRAVSYTHLTLPTKA